MSAKNRPCEVCMKPIDTNRLETLPETRLCAEHAKQVQQFGGEFIVSATQERTSKTGSLKINYGSISISKQRNQTAIEKLKDAYFEERQASME